MENITLEALSELPKGMGLSPGVYVIEHVSTGSMYVGSTGELGQRKRWHLSTLRLGKNRNAPLQRAYDEDPQLDFTFIPTKTKEEAVAFEQQLLDHLQGDPRLLNIAPNAKAPGLGLIRSEETRARISVAGIGRESFNKGKPMTDSHHQNLIASREKLAKPVEINGVCYPSLAEATRQLNVSLGCAWKRINTHTNQFKNWRYA